MLLGLKHYWDQLLDADLESDALGWQYLSGCMVDEYCTCPALGLHAHALQRCGCAMNVILCAAGHVLPMVCCRVV
jgi:hypothetical protein